ncbi:7772_t:CDS:2 [Diversispora eburnea]|uniref:7772_t:CDS:1 n=1 Tax=Diversispora eburnea TaxID=1213867 RepID=A0A9N8YK43_9GLOM|nr:7772_t:CDS:2 [Diversispora eburnea]
MVTTFTSLNSVQMFNEKQDILDSHDDIEFLLKNVNISVLKLDNLDEDEIYGLFTASDEFMLDDLLEAIPDDIGEGMDFWIDQDCIPVMSTIFGMDSYKKLREPLVNKINANAEWLLEAEDLPCMEENVMAGFLSQKNLAFDHITRWDLIIKWALSQRPNLDKEVIKRWSDEEFGLLGMSLQNLIPLIQFSEMSRNDIHSKVLPYGKILSQGFDNAALKWYLTKYKSRGSHGLKNSNIINHQHAAHFIKWIGTKHDENHPKVPCRYNFELIYQLSRDGIHSYAEKCDQMGPTLAVAKVAGQRCLIGGYDPHGLRTDKSSTYQHDGISVKDNFIFFFDNRSYTSKSIRCKLSRFDTLYRNFLSEDGPCFGDLRLILEYKSGAYMPSFYTPYLTQMFFDIEECEVFKVIKVDKTNKKSKK